jgi:hypothetical protein
MRNLHNIIQFFSLTIICGSFVALHCGKSISSGVTQRIDRPPHINPDYSDIVVPPNIAPMNFRILEDGEAYKVTIQSGDQPPLLIRSSKPNIIVPTKPWRKLLEESRGETFHIEVEVLTADNTWHQFAPITNRVAREPIDGYLVYRRMKPIHNFWGSMGIYQRTLADFTEKPLLLNRTIGNGCINCHVFYQKRPERMVLHTRGKIGSGMLVADGDRVIKVDTRTPFNKGPVVFRSWHPNGKILATSVNQLIQFFHATGESREVCDLSSDLLLYHFDTNVISTYPAIASRERMETFPCWSADGKSLYFCSSPKIESYVTPEDKDFGTIYKRVMYDLYEIDYDPATDSWGKVTTILSAAETGRSVLMPSISPDGRFLLFCMADYGCFPVLLKSSDIYIMDLTTGDYYKPDINSDQSESNYSWASNSRWFAFGSKRLDGLCARPYFCYMDEHGGASKPFILPQKDPEFYDKLLDTYNVPEFVTGPVKASWQSLSHAALDNKSMIKATLDKKVNVDGVTGATAPPTWQQPLH